jgi:nicotinamidase-related amidase
MPPKNRNLHGNAPDSCEAAVLLIDVINDLEFETGTALLKTALPAARRIAHLTAKARALNVPVIYANDNFGRWRSDFSEAVEHCLTDDVRGRRIAELLAPQPEDYFVLKPKHSAFFSTVLETLLKYLRTRRLVIAGFAGDACVLMTAADAYVRDFEVCVPRDCIASASPSENRKALAFMARVLHADTSPASKLNLARMAGRAQRRRKRTR